MSDLYTEGMVFVCQGKRLPMEECVVILIAEFDVLDIAVILGEYVYLLTVDKKGHVTSASVF